MNTGTPQKTEPTGPRTSWNWLWLLCLVALFNQVVMNMARPVTSYKLIALGFDEATIGLIAAAYATVPLFVALPLGRWIDRAGNIRVLVSAGMVIMAGGMALLGASEQLVFLALAFTTLGLGQLVFTIAGQAAVARYTPASKLDAGFGWFTAAFSGGQLLGPLVAGAVLGAEQNLPRDVLLQRADQALWLALILSVIAVPLVFLPVRWVLPRSSTSAGKAASEAKATLLGVVRLPAVGSHLFAALTLLAILDILTAFLPLVGEHFGVSPQWIGVLLALRGAASITSRFLLPTLSRHFRREHLIVASLLISSVAISASAMLVQHKVLAAALMIIGGFFLGLGQPITMTLITQTVPSNWRSTALAVRLLGNRAGQVVVPLLAGLVAGPAGPAGAVLLACGLLAASGIEKTVRLSATGKGKQSAEPPQ
ncbi:MFS transporter [Micrococcoides hystricis]|uniref:MFS transporter n=1 Tax=Micrococcoides hystricis TaxID=1572761 RepID=A0ABV6PCN8_9MICC